MTGDYKSRIAAAALAFAIFASNVNVAVYATVSDGGTGADTSADSSLSVPTEKEEAYSYVLRLNGGTLVNTTGWSEFPAGAASSRKEEEDTEEGEIILEVPEVEGDYYAISSLCSVVLPSATRSGYTFGGWKETTTSVVTAGGETYTVEGLTTVTFEAVWTENPSVNNVTASVSTGYSSSVTYGSDSTQLEVTVSAVSAFKLNYQWYECVDANGSNAFPISGATFNKLMISGSESIGTHYYYCQVSATSNASIISEPMSSNIVSVKIKASNVNLTVPSVRYSKKYGDGIFNLGASVKNSSGAITSFVGSLLYSSSDPNVATVDSSGNVTIKGVGNANITISLSSEMYKATPVTVSITVSAGTQSIAFPKSSISLTYGVDNSYNCAVFGAVTGVIYKSSNTNICTVNGSGIITVVGTGTATITATAQAGSQYGAATATCTVTVEEGSLEDEDFTVTAYSGTYDIKSHKAVTVKGTLNSDSVMYSTNGGASYTDTAPEVQNVSDTENLEVIVKITRKNYGDYTVTAHPCISKATLDMSGVSFKSSNVTYDGKAHALKLSGTLPDGVSVSYSENSFTNAGSYKVTASFKVDDNYNSVKDLTATLTIEKADIDVSNVKFANMSFTYDGSAHSLEVKNIPKNVTVSYEGNGQINAGSYKVTASFTVPDNYNSIKSATATLTITKATFDTSKLKFENQKVTYDGSEHKIEISGILPEGLTVDYANNTRTDAGKSTAVASFTVPNANYATPTAMKATLTISKASPNLKYTVTSASTTYGSAPAIVAYTYSGDGKISTKVSGPAKAKLDKSAKKVTITPSGCGSVTLTINSAATTNYKKGTAQYTMNVDKLITKISCNVDNATVTLSNGTKSATSDENKFLLTYGKEYTYTVSATGYTTVSKTFVAKATSISVMLSRAKTDIKFKVSGTKKAILTVYNENKEIVNPKSSDSTTYELEIGKSYSYVVSASDEGFEDISSSIEVTEDVSAVDVKFSKEGNSVSVETLEANTDEEPDTGIESADGIEHFEGAANVDSADASALPESDSSATIFGNSSEAHDGDTSITEAVEATNNKKGLAIRILFGAVVVLVIVAAGVMVWRRKREEEDYDEDDPEDEFSFADEDGISYDDSESGNGSDDGDPFTDE